MRRSCVMTERLTPLDTPVERIRNDPEDSSSIVSSERSGSQTSSSFAGSSSIENFESVPETLRHVRSTPGSSRFTGLG